MAGDDDFQEASGFTLVESHKVTLPTPEPLDLDPDRRAASWKKFKKKFNFYLKASKLDKEPPEMQAYTFLLMIGDEALEVMDSFGLTEAKQGDLVVLY